MPDHWTPQQALAVFDFLNDLQNLIWDRYEKPLVELILADLDNEQPIPSSPEDFDDEIPF